MKILTGRLEILRKYLNLSKKNVISLSRIENYSDIEKGLIEPTKEQADFLAKVLKIDLAWLTGEGSHEKENLNDELSLILLKLKDLSPKKLERISLFLRVVETDNKYK